MIEAFPHHYTTDLTWEIERRGWVSAPPRQGISAGAPVQFGGTDEVWSPEHLLVASANLCLMLTFLSIAEGSRLPVAGWRSHAEGTLDKAADGIRFVSVSMEVDLKVDEADRARAEALLRKAEKHCLIANSLKTRIQVTLVPVRSPVGAGNGGHP